LKSVSYLKSARRFAAGFNLQSSIGNSSFLKSEIGNLLGGFRRWLQS